MFLIFLKFTIQKYLWNFKSVQEFEKLIINLIYFFCKFENVQEFGEISRIWNKNHEFENIHKFKEMFAILKNVHEIKKYSWI